MTGGIGLSQQQQFTSHYGLAHHHHHPHAYHSQQTVSTYSRHPVLASAIFLWGAFLSRPGPLSTHEQHFLSRTQSLLVDALNISQYQQQGQSQSQQQRSSGTSPQPQRQTAATTPSLPQIPALGTVIIDTIQASCLLARYFFALGRLHEAGYHTSAAANLAVQAGLHQIASVSNSSMYPGGQAQQWSGAPVEGFVSTEYGGRSTAGFMGGPSMHSVNPPLSPSFSTLRLPPPVDAVELGERIGAFWQSFVLDRLVSVAVRRPASIADDDCVDTRIDTPWPEEIEEYENVCISYSPYR